MSPGAVIGRDGGGTRSQGGAAVAALPMYDWPEIADATDRFWHAIARNLRERGFDPPAALDRARDVQTVWRDPDLLLAQTCGYPFATALRETASLVGTPAYEIDAAPGRYYSVIIAGHDDDAGSLAELASGRFAFNAADSQSGFRAPERLLMGAGLALPADRLETGAHRASIRAVAAGEARFAAIDAVTWQLALRHEPATTATRAVARTPETPGLPLITAAANAAQAPIIAAAVRRAIAELDDRAARALLLLGLAEMDRTDYAPLA